MTQRIGIYFVSRQGQTRAIAGRIGQCLVNAGHEVSIIDLEGDPMNRPGLHEFDTILIGAPLYIRRYPRPVRRFLRAKRDELKRHASTGFFSVSLSKSLGPLQELLSDIAWTPAWIASFRDHDLTEWNEVARFADHIGGDVAESPYRSSAISLPARGLDRVMPKFEQRITARLTIPATPDEIRVGLNDMRPADMPLAKVLAHLRTIGRPQPELPFADLSRQFGAVPITAAAEPHEVIGGLAGRFWQRDFGIARLKDETDYTAFNEPGYTKTVTDFWFDDMREEGTVVRTETRIHSLGADAQSRFWWYWLLLSPGIRLYMRSALHGIRRAVRRRRE